MRPRAASRWCAAAAAAGVAAGAIVVAVGCAKDYGTEPEPPVAPEAGGAIEGGGDAPPVCAPSQLAVDSKNCGRCGHDCLGGACKDGACQPIELAHRDGLPIGFGVTSDTVAWIEKRALYRCAKTGCSGAPKETLEALGFNALATSSSAVFVTIAGGLNARVKRFDAAGATDISSPGGSSYLVASDEQRVYVVVSDTPQNKVLVLDHDGKELGVTSDSRNYSVLAANVATLVTGTYGSLYACALPQCSGGLTLLAGMTDDGGATDFIGGPTDLVLGPKDAYWTSHDLPGVYTCAIANAPCKRGTLISGAALPSGARADALTLDGTTLVIATSEGKLATCAAASCESTWKTLAVAPRIVGRPAFDGVAFYWVAADAPAPADAADTVSYRVMKLAK